jgi:membrane-bound lytic murein transglycosylase A
MQKTFRLFLLALLTGCAATQPSGFTLTPASFADLPGWNEDRQSEALAAFARSCATLRDKQSPHDWRPACDAAAQVPAQDDAAARGFFERYLRPYSVNDGADGLFTGYYEAELHGSTEHTSHYNTPLYVRPEDLVSVDLGQFKPELKGQHLAGKVADNKLVPYDDRAAIAANSLEGRAHVLLWVDDPIDAFFLEIQGSGRVQLADGRVARLGYDCANGHAYEAIGRDLSEMGEIDKPVTMQSIRQWLTRHPDRAQEIMNLNASYVFFHTLDGDGPIGAEGVALTPMRSLAVDPSYVPLGAPVWLDSRDPTGAPLQRLLVAQDTGGAIKGAVRGDLFWGAGKDAETGAGAMQSRGRYFILLPKDG